MRGAIVFGLMRLLAAFAHCPLFIVTYVTN